MGITSQPLLERQQLKFDRLVNQTTFIRALGKRLKEQIKPQKHDYLIDLILTNQNIFPNMIHQKYGESYAKVLKRMCNEAYKEIENVNI